MHPGCIESRAQRYDDAARLEEQRRKLGKILKTTDHGARGRDAGLGSGGTGVGRERRAVLGGL